MRHDNKATEAALTLAKTKQTKVSKRVKVAKIKHTTNDMDTSRQKYTLKRAWFIAYRHQQVVLHLM